MNLKQLRNNRILIVLLAASVPTGVLFYFLLGGSTGSAPASPAGHDDELMLMLAKYEKKYVRILRELAMNPIVDGQDETFAAPFHSESVRDVFTMPGFHPMAPGGHRRQAGPLLLEGILFEADRAMAVISGAVVARGDSVDRFRVEAITPRSVILRSGDKVVELELAVDDRKASSE